MLVVDLNLDKGEHKAVVRLARELTRHAGGQEARVIHHSEVGAETMATYKPKAVVLSPQSDPWWQYPPETLSRLSAWVRALEVPVLGVCGGHQFLAMAYGGTVAPIDGEIGAPNYDGMVREKGIARIKLLRADPLFEGWSVEARIPVAEYHAEEIKTLPKGFVLLARGDFSAFQAIRHPTRPVYGVQFHPESRRDVDRVGERVLINFLKVAGIRR